MTDKMAVDTFLARAYFECINGSSWPSSLLAGGPPKWNPASGETILEIVGMPALLPVSVYKKGPGLLEILVEHHSTGRIDISTGAHVLEPDGGDKKYSESLTLLAGIIASAFRTAIREAQLG